MFLKNKVICSKCNGNKLIPKHIDILSVCDKCNGYGELDWIENVTKSRMTTTESFNHAVDLRNAQLLAVKIKEIVGKYHPNVTVIVKVEAFENNVKEQHEIMRV